MFVCCFVKLLTILCVNMLVFSNVAESKQFESIAPMADGSVESVDVVGCLKGPS